MSFFDALSRPLRAGLQKTRDFLNRDVLLDFSAGLIVPAALKPLLVLSEGERARQRQVLKSRAFHEGDHGVMLTDRLKEFLGAEVEDAPCLNFTQMVCMAVVERIKIEGFECDDANYLAWALRVWDDSRMRTKQADAWEETGVDGEHFILVNWNTAGAGAGEVEFIPHPRYTDPSIGFEHLLGDGYGMMMVYPGGDTSRRPLYAVKRSTEENETGQKQKQITIYRPASIERYYLDPKAGWLPMREVDPVTGNDKAWPQPWLTATGEPMGIPVVHIKNPRLTAEARQAQRLQRALNKLFLDFLIANDENAFRIWVYAGWDPLEISTAPGSWIGDASKSKSDFLAQAVDGADTTPMTAGIDKVIGWLAQVTSTPTARLSATGQVARAETLQQEERPLGAKVENRQESYGQAITDAFRIGARIQNRYAPTGNPLDENARARPVWKPFNEAATTAAPQPVNPPN